MSETNLKPSKLYYRRSESFLENSASLKTPFSYRPHINYNFPTLSANTDIIYLHNQRWHFNLLPTITSVVWLAASPIPLDAVQRYAPLELLLVLLMT